MKHGRPSTYTNHRCRCAACRTAFTRYSRDYRHRTGRTRPHPDYLADIRAEAEARNPCGTYAAYRRGCRCEACRAAVAARQRRYRAARS